MTKLFFTIVLSALVFGCAAQQPNGDAESTAQSERRMPMQPMQGMQARMQHMRELMDRIHGTSDAAERRRLMDEHMRAMSEGMAMMGSMMGGAALLQQRMDMMQGMMGQMMEHMTIMPPAEEPAASPGAKPDAGNHEAHR